MKDRPTESDFNHVCGHLESLLVYIRCRSTDKMQNNKDLASLFQLKHTFKYMNRIKEIATIHTYYYLRKRLSTFVGKHTSSMYYE